jgi:acetyl esterase/lipase
MGVSMGTHHKGVLVSAAALAGSILLSVAVSGVCQDTRTPPKPLLLAAVEQDIAYGGAEEQKLDLYLPVEREFTTVVFTYGGGWHSGSRKSVASVGEKLQRLGFGTALLSHRLSPKDRFPAQIEDVAAAFAWVKRNIAGKGGDPHRVFLMGHSSGAHLSLLLASDPRYLAAHGLSPADVSGCIGLSSPVDLELRKDGKGFGNALMAGRGADVFARDLNVMRDASPIVHVGKGLPRILLVVGERDFPMLEGDARVFVEKARGVGGSAALFVAPDRDHMGVIRSLVEVDSHVLKQVVDFLTGSGR